MFCYEEGSVQTADREITQEIPRWTQVTSKVVRVKLIYRRLPCRWDGKAMSPVRNSAANVL